MYLVGLTQMELMTVFLLLKSKTLQEAIKPQK